MDSGDKRSRAIELASTVYSFLQEAGISEEFLPMMHSIASVNKGTFFGSFGSDSGCFIEFKQKKNSLTPAQMCFGVLRYRPSLRARIAEAWSALMGGNVEYCIDLKPEDITKFKDLLRMLN